MLIVVQMIMLIAAGSAWRWLRPQGLDVDQTRTALSSVVYHLFLPALVLDVMWQTPLSADSLRIPFVAIGCIVLIAPLAWLVYARWLKQSRGVVGALVLAAVFPNATYMGLPFLEGIFGAWARGVAIQYDLFACTPLLMTAGIAFARAHGQGQSPQNPLATLLRIPPLWALVAAIGLNLAGIPMPALIAGLLELMSGAVVPLMLLAIGMGLRWNLPWQHSLGLLLPVAIAQLLAMPALAFALGIGIGLQGETLKAIVLEASMPTMVLGIVICDRYHLASSLYAAAVTVTTLLSLLILPGWIAFTHA